MWDLIGGVLYLGVIGATIAMIKRREHSAPPSDTRPPLEPDEPIPDNRPPAATWTTPRRRGAHRLRPVTSA